MCLESGAEGPVMGRLMISKKRGVLIRDKTATNSEGLNKLAIDGWILLSIDDLTMINWQGMVVANMVSEYKLLSQSITMSIG